MADKDIYIGSEQIKKRQNDINGELIEMEGEQYYKITNYDTMPPFFMNLNSDSNVWMFVSSKGGISAGRANPDQAIFPYYTDDQIEALSDCTGSFTAFLVDYGYKQQFWSPFSERYDGIYKITRNLYKNNLGNKLIFEEVNHDLLLCYRYSWQNSRRLGIIKKSEIINLSSKNSTLKILDGLLNVMPPGILQGVQQTKSNLANAYKRSELLIKSGIGIYSLSSNIIDRAEPSEAMKATICWSSLNEDVTHLLSANQVDKFVNGDNIESEFDLRGKPGAYIISSTQKVEGNGQKSYYIVVDTNIDATQLKIIDQKIQNEKNVGLYIQSELNLSSENLKSLLSKSDGFQKTSDQIANFRHVSNSLFNVMRGGFFSDDYKVYINEFAAFLNLKNKSQFENEKPFLESIANDLAFDDLLKILDKHGNRDLLRIAFEYLPITFSRRHGDPSRPWNRFNIDIHNKDGSWKKKYEGNWRDIFQNWEALSYAYPEFIEHFITVFLNTSTIDGYNPYRITSHGFEWEVTDPDDPWSFIGYWGDHQIIYLLKLLELSTKFHPGKLEQWADVPFFTFADIPYRIKRYEDIVKDPYNTIVYDKGIEKSLESRVEQIGEDGKLVWTNSAILKANLIDKLLLPLLTKLSNYIPGGGIWMNTQRPEWNDANNALVGHGLSMVTVFYINRYLLFLKNFVRQLSLQHVNMLVPIASFFSELSLVFSQYEESIGTEMTSAQRKGMVDALGSAGEKYRAEVYSEIEDYRKKINCDDLISFIDSVQIHISDTIRTNQRKDHLFHSYNLLNIGADGYQIDRLYEMLEGQVSVLSAGYLNVDEAEELLAALRKSALYRKDVGSYILYPDRKLPQFIEKGLIKDDQVRQSRLLELLIENSNGDIVQKDVFGNIYFNASICNARDLSAAMEKLPDEYVSLLKQEKLLIHDIYEYGFQHHQFTGRSGTFFAYEGLGSVYWHMNSKLLLAVQEVIENALKEDKNIDALENHYKEIKEGLGVHKNPSAYGAFPIDPYSHTPAGRGAQQPGMTGQVKEDIISRYGELGVRIEEGKLSFCQRMINTNEFLRKPAVYEYFQIGGDKDLIELEEGSLAFTFCQTLIIYVNGFENKIVIHYSTKDIKEIQGHILSEDISNSIFKRIGEIAYIQVHFRIS